MTCTGSYIPKGGDIFPNLDIFTFGSLYVFRLTTWFSTVCVVEWLCMPRGVNVLGGEKYLCRRASILGFRLSFPPNFRRGRCPASAYTIIHPHTPACTHTRPHNYMPIHPHTPIYTHILSHTKIKRR